MSTSDLILTTFRRKENVFSGKGCFKIHVDHKRLDPLLTFWDSLVHVHTRVFVCVKFIYIYLLKLT